MNAAKIMAVDDDVRQLKSVVRMLRRSRFQVEACANPVRALRMAFANPPNLILLDISMPKMSGHEFLRRLRRARDTDLAHRAALKTIEIARNIPVIFVTGLADIHQRVSGLDAGADDYVTKPFDADELRARIRNHLKRTRHQEESLATICEQQLRAETALDAVLENVQSCEGSLYDLRTNLDLARMVRGDSLRKDCIARAMRDARHLKGSLERMADSYPRAAREPIAGRPTMKAESGGTL